MIQDRSSILQPSWRPRRMRRAPAAASDWHAIAPEFAELGEVALRGPVVALAAAAAPAGAAAS